jgi:hypothetical protein
MSVPVVYNLIFAEKQRRFQMGSKEEMPDILSTYSPTRHYMVSDLAASLFNRTALSDTRSEDEQEGRQEEKKRRDDE